MSEIEIPIPLAIATIAALATIAARRLQSPDCDRSPALDP
jgi:hypothetical protein